MTINRAKCFFVWNVWNTFICTSLWEHFLHQNQMLQHHLAVFLLYYFIKQLFIYYIQCSEFIWCRKTDVQNERARIVIGASFLKYLCVCGLTQWDGFLNSFQLFGAQTVLMLITHSAAHTTARGKNNIMLSAHIPWGVFTLHVDGMLWQG